MGQILGFWPFADGCNLAGPVIKLWRQAARFFWAGPGLRLDQLYVSIREEVNFSFYG